jgi:hypothetical protein
MASPAFGFKVVVTDPTTVIQRRLRESIATHMNDAVRASMRGIRVSLLKLIEGAIRNAPETQELKGGILQAELGPPSSLVDSWIDYVIAKLVSTIDIKFVPIPIFKGKFAGKLTVSILPKNLMDDVIAHSAGSYLTDKGVRIPWVEWLLKLGDKIIVREFKVNYNNPQNSRTGLATMAKTKTKGWRVPPAYSGKINDNMITRALDDWADQVPYIIEKELVKNI